MRRVAFALALSFCATQFAYAVDSTCESKAADKHLAGAAKTSFMKKCQADTKVADPSAGCEAKAKGKKLAGAAKASFMKKCVADTAPAK